MFQLLRALYLLLIVSRSVSRSLCQFSWLPRPTPPPGALYRWQQMNRAGSVYIWAGAYNIFINFAGVVKNNRGHGRFHLPCCRKFTYHCVLTMQRSMSNVELTHEKNSFFTQAKPHMRSLHNERGRLEVSLFEASFGSINAQGRFSVLWLTVLLPFFFKTG